MVIDRGANSGTGKVRIRWDVSVAPEVLADQADPVAYVADLLGLLHLVNAEDRPIVEGVFRGVHSFGDDRPIPRIGLVPLYARCRAKYTH